MVERPIRIVSTGSYLPGTPVPSSEIDRRARRACGTTARQLNIEHRHFCQDETSSEMAALAARQALAKARWRPEDLDLIVSASAVMEQPIPTQGVLIQEKLGLSRAGTPVLDVNTTCLSFVSALDTVSFAMAAGQYRRVLIVSSEIASRGLDWADLIVSGNFGDGAAAVLIEHAPQGQAGILSSRFQTHSEGARLCELRAGGTLIDARKEPLTLFSNAVFKMDGKATYKLALQHIPKFISSLIEGAGLDLSGIDLIVPHQASAQALAHLKRMLNFPREKVVDIFARVGNQIAASIPMALHHAIEEERLRRGDAFLLVGTSAGISLGGLVLRY